MLLLSILFTITGLILGSFFNVLIWRLPRNESILWPASHCPQCGHAIRPWENIPVISYLFLGGKCSGCKKKIPLIYPLIELITGLSALGLSFLFVNTLPQQISWVTIIPQLIQYTFLLLMIPMAIIDSKHYIIPDQITLPIIATGFLLSFLPDMITPFESLLGIIVGGGSLYVVGWIGTAILKKGEAMGGGDIKLMSAAGALWGAQISLLSIVLGALSGSIVGIVLIGLRKLSSNHRIPFGPFLGAGIWISALAGKELLNFYSKFFN